VKARAYRDDAGARSAGVALRLALSTMLRLLAPFLVYVTEEVWSWWREGSIHRAPWPSRSELPGGETPYVIYGIAADVLAEVRKAKSEQKRSLATPVTRAFVRDDAVRIEALELVRSDVAEAGKIAALETEAGPELLVKVELEPEAPVDA